MVSKLLIPSCMKKEKKKVPHSPVIHTYPSASSGKEQYRGPLFYTPGIYTAGLVLIQSLTAHTGSSLPPQSEAVPFPGLQSLAHGRGGDVDPAHHSSPVGRSEGGTHRTPGHMTTPFIHPLIIFHSPITHLFTDSKTSTCLTAEREKPAPHTVGLRSHRHLKLHIDTVRGLLRCAVAVLGLVTLQQVSQLGPQTITAGSIHLLPAPSLHTLAASPLRPQQFPVTLSLRQLP
ncbi:hypothetical protein E2C01_015217 [Portunus trituberculatus]|uniref:Uncharacterized protein n=1 Tax=Portunus trituberculatus TaxID=210409 RepID=A0A5B7DMK0_PORTR|nr:hypothetical protein [Portunus trituberculatus]